MRKISWKKLARAPQISVEASAFCSNVKSVAPRMGDLTPLLQGIGWEDIHNPYVTHTVQ